MCICWRNEPEASLPLIFPYRNARGAAPYVAQLNEARKQAEAEENNRLLYVALTRAEEELVIAGVEPGRSSTKHWYHTITSGMDTLGEACLTLPAQESYPFWPHAEEAGDIRRFGLHLPAASATATEDTAPAAMHSATQYPIPSWLDSPPPEEPTPAKPLTPIRDDGDPTCIHHPPLRPPPRKRSAYSSNASRWPMAPPCTACCIWRDASPRPSVRHA
jgi:ATP-dependent helicase/nuclease subunit A